MSLDLHSRHMGISVDRNRRMMKFEHDALRGRGDSARLQSYQCGEFSPGVPVGVGPLRRQQVIGLDLNLDAVEIIWYRRVRR